MSVEASLQALLGTPVRTLRPVSGGDVCAAWHAELDDGRTVFTKTHPRGATMFEHEADGLRWLADANAIRVPDVLGRDGVIQELRGDESRAARRPTKR